MKWYRRWAIGLSTGYILFFFSEEMFWSRFRADDDFGALILTYLIYSMLAYAMLGIAHYFRANNVWAVFLAGACYGWLNEGILVQTTYEDLPFSLSFTPLAWHALISVIVGWYWLRAAMQRGAFFQVAMTSVGMGLFWGTWAINWWLGNDIPKMISIQAFILFAFGLTFLLILAYWSEAKLNHGDFSIQRWEAMVLILFFTTYFTLNTIRKAPVALLLLPPLLLFVFLTLQKHKKAQPNDNHPTNPHRDIPFTLLGTLLLMPASASSVYALASIAHIRFPTNIPIALFTMFLGFIFFVIACVKIWQPFTKSSR